MHRVLYGRLYGGSQKYSFRHEFFPHPLLGQHSRSSSRITDYDGFSLEQEMDDEDSSVCERVTKNSVRALVLAWLAEDNLPFTTIETPAFRRFIVGCCTKLADLVPFCDFQLQVIDTYRHH